MKHTLTQIIVLLLLILYLTIRYLTTPHLKVGSSFNFGIKNGILSTNEFPSDSIKDLNFIAAVFPAHTSGGYCFTKSVNNGETINYLNHKIKLLGSDILIDDHILTAGEKRVFQKPQIKLVNLWWIYINKLELTNFSPLFAIQNDKELTKLEYSRYLIVGKYTSREILNPLILILYLGLLVILTLLLIRRFNKSTNRQHGQ